MRIEFGMIIPRIDAIRRSGRSEVSLRDRSIVIVGGTHGMGHATAKAACGRGARVMVTGSNDRNVARAQAELGEAVVVARSDISRIDDIDTLVQRARSRFGTLDALLLFAGVADLEPVADVTERSYDRQFAVNTRGVFFAMQRFAPIIKDGGSITVTTVTPATATPSMSVYMGTKAAVLAFARVLAAELLPRRIRVNAVAPGFISTPTLGMAGLTPQEREQFARIGDDATPMRRHGTMEEIARAALFLAFEATYSTGIELPVDGGLSTLDKPMAA
jgi:NAD(P)-dependent dehydrogenase (short-subunit alcohol dehydrogenase family)